MSPEMTKTSADAAVITFDDGIPGFPDAHDFFLADIGGENAAFQLLQSVDDEELSMVVTHPWLFFPDYAPEIPDADSAELGLSSADNAVVFCPVTLDAASERIYVNLLGPFVVNTETNRGRQVVLAESDYQARVPVQLDLT